LIHLAIEIGRVGINSSQLELFAARFSITNDSPGERFSSGAPCLNCLPEILSLGIVITRYLKQSGRSRDEDPGIRCHREDGGIPVQSTFEGSSLVFAVQVWISILQSGQTENHPVSG
jgi:hypothetical protein